MSVTDILEYAFERFNNGEYKEAMKGFMAAHVGSENPEEKEEIFQVIFKNFIEPNEEEFRQAYEKNVEKLISDKVVSNEVVPEYEELSLYMIPISDSEYYVWDRNNDCFWGSDSISTATWNSKAKKMFDSIIIDGFSDLRAILTEFKEYLYANSYFVLTENDARNRFFSFLMLPSILEMLPDSIHIYDDRQQLADFLYETGNYIPKTIKTINDYDYSDMMQKIHNKRLLEPKKNMPYVSIAIPTFNRGKKALENVHNLLKLLLDEEIEIVICNNSSKEQQEYYDEIEKIAEKDSRIKYKVMPSEAFEDSFVNVLKAVRTKYAILCSDEDFLINENITYALQELYEHVGYGIISFGTDTGYSDGYYRFDKGIEKKPGSSGLQAGFGCNYITGLCVNVEYLKKSNVISEYETKYKRKNGYYNQYTHCVYMAYLGYKEGMYATNLTLFCDCNSSGKLAVYKNGTFIMEHIFVEERIKQAKEQIEILFDMGVSYEEAVNCIFFFVSRLFSLTRIGYGHYYEEMINKHSWEENCKEIAVFFDNLMEKLKKEKQFGDDALTALRQNFIVLYSKEINESPERF